jgi:hypothetical protein
MKNKTSFFKGVCKNFKIIKNNPSPIALGLNITTI